MQARENNNKITQHRLTIQQCFEIKFSNLF